MKLHNKFFFIFGVIFIFYFSNANAHARNNEERLFKFSLYGSWGGYGIFYDLGGEVLYDRFLGLNLGYSSWEIENKKEDGGDITLTFFPVHLAYYMGENHRFYLQGGGTYIKANFDNFWGDTYFLDELSESKWVFSGGLGYNYCPDNMGIFFKVGPIFYIVEGILAPWFSISLGITF